MKKDLIIARCGFDTDVQMVRSFLSLRKEPCDYVLLENRIKNVKMLESSLPEIPAGAEYASVKAFLKKEIPLSGIDRLVVIHSFNAFSRPDELERALSHFSSRPGDYLLYDSNPLTRLRMEILTGAAVEAIATSETVSEFLRDGGIPASEIVTPADDSYRYYFSEKFDQFFAYPKLVLLQLVDQCSKRCPKCAYYEGYVSDTHGTNTEMPLEMAEKVLKEISQYREKPVVSPILNCEPLLYSRLKEFLDLTKQYGLLVSFTTNAMQLTEEKAALLLSYDNIANISFSVDAVSEEVYRQLQPPGKLAKVEENIERFLRMKGDRKISTSMSFVLSDVNAHEELPFVEKWGKKFTAIGVMSKMSYTGDSSTFTPMSKTYDHIPCPAFWNGISVDYKGEIVCCWIMNRKWEKRYSIHDITLEQFWNMEHVNGIRKSILSDNPPLLCQNCFNCGNIVGGTEFDRHGDFEVMKTVSVRTYYYRPEKAGEKV